MPDTPHAAEPGYSVADLCRRWRVGADKVRGFIARGELVAVNVAADVNARPQFRVTPESVTAFERRRSTEPQAKTPRKRRRSERVDYTKDW